MQRLTDITGLPQTPAVYALYKSESTKTAAYVGIGGKLRQRIVQHLVLRKSSISTGTAAVGLHPDRVRRVDWWEDPAFEDQTGLLAAELIAFDVLDPDLRSRAHINHEARALSDDSKFRSQIELLFRSPPTGRLSLASVPDLDRRLIDVDRRLQEIEKRLTLIEQSLPTSSTDPKRRAHHVPRPGGDNRAVAHS